MAAANGQQPAVLTSWKEIASYLGRGVRTVQRWELHFGLPVRRPNQRAKGIVHASRAELDQWLAVHWTPRNGEPKVSNDAPTNHTPTSPQALLRPSIQASRELHDTLHVLLKDMRQSLARLNAECRALQSGIQDDRIAPKLLGPEGTSTRDGSPLS